jgi:PIN domain nuclease of toxin-antitoxin system
VKFLLDTQVMLWLFSEPRKIGRKHLPVLADPNNVLYVSAVSTWEASIKVALGKLKLPGDRAPSAYLPTAIRRAGFTPMPITAEHTYGVASLAMHHHDPFDRLLIAQARVENVTIVTSDRLFTKYDIATMLLR